MVKHKTKNRNSTTPSSDDPIFFFKPDDANYGFFCQWYIAPFHDPKLNLSFNCCEQYMMYHKALHFSDTDTAAAVMATPDPKQQKLLGRGVQGFDVKAWDAVKEDVVERGNWLKFTQGTNKNGCAGADGGGKKVKLGVLLLATGNRELVEASKRDRVWGIGFGEHEAASVDRTRWGQNLLGKALMKVRERLERREQDKGESGEADAVESANREARDK